MIPVEQAQAEVLTGLSPLPAVAVPIDRGVGRVTDHAILAAYPVPGFANSSMDGFAIRASDTVNAPTTLVVTGSIMAGDAPTRAIGSGEAMRIMTGAPIPPGADAVCKIEDVTLDGDRAVIVSAIVTEGTFIRRPGDDIAVGQVVVAAGEELGPAHIGVLASQGWESVVVHPSPRVGVLSTGDELSDAPGELEFGKIRDVNRPTLRASLLEAGATVVDLGHVGDEREQIARRLAETIDSCDAVVTTGGVSVGDADFVKSVLVDLCGERARWMQVAVRPGKPFAFGLAGARATPIFGLPGNPVSTLVSFELFVRPSLRRLGGHRELHRPVVAALLDVDLPRQPDGKLHLVHVTASFHEDGRVHVERAARQGSHLLSALTGANAIARLPDGTGLHAGDGVDVLVIAPLFVTGA